MIGDSHWIRELDRDRPVLIAGPTASGKSSLALRIAEHTGGPIVNADALQVFSDWRILTARPSDQDEATHPHALYGHVAGTTPYSVGEWLRDVRPFLTGPAPVIVGGTGLYFTALTEGLADIPATPPAIRAEANDRMNADGKDALFAELDADTQSRLDRQNPMRIQRAWEVQKTTGQGLARWQDRTGPPLLPLDRAQAIALSAPKDWLTPRIMRRLDQMVAEGALEEAETNAPLWTADRPSAKAIGAREFISHVRGEIGFDAAKEAAVIQTRQYAKRQRSWFKGRMQSWQWVEAAEL